MSNISLQASYFYDPYWTELMDELLIHHLCPVASPRNFRHFDPLNATFVDMIGNINEYFGTLFSYYKAGIQFDKLRKRYDTFRYVKNHFGVFWDKYDNLVHATAYVWKIIIKVHPFAEAYVEKGEPEWESLAHIFGVPSDQDEDLDVATTEVVIISSGDDEVIVVDDESDAVDSKPVRGPTKIVMLRDYATGSEDTEQIVIPMEAIMAMSPSSSVSFKPTSNWEKVKRKLFRPAASNEAKIEDIEDVRTDDGPVQPVDKGKEGSADFSSDRESSTASFSPFK